MVVESVGCERYLSTSNSHHTVDLLTHVSVMLVHRSLLIFSTPIYHSIIVTHLVCPSTSLTCFLSMTGCQVLRAYGVVRA